MTDNTDKGTDSIAYDKLIVNVNQCYPTGWKACYLGFNITIGAITAVGAMICVGAAINWIVEYFA